ncbi:MAG: beta-ketoacyl synthase N-terminal-like domain-containing protein, partial [bacterium]
MSDVLVAPSELQRAEAAAHVVITGAGLITSAGATPEECLCAVRDHTCEFRAMSAMESALPAGSVGSQAVDIDARAAEPREAEYLRRALHDALAAAGLPLAGDNRRRMLMLGTTLHGIRAGGRFLRSGDAAELKHFLANATTAHAAGGMNFAAGVMTTCSACSSGLGAITLATTLLRAGHADVVVAGGYDVISEYAWAGFSSLRLVARGGLRPFAHGREGMKLGEGYAIVVLERAVDAVARRAVVRAYVAGWGESADSHHLTQPLPTGEGAARAMRLALQRAGVPASQIGLAVAHATGTPDNDASEAAALTSVLGAARGAVPVVGLKSHVGHTLGAAGAVELVLAAEAMREGAVLTCRQVEAAAVEFERLGVATGPSRPARINATINSSLGFGGANTSVVLTSGPSGAAPDSRASPVARAVWITGMATLTAAPWPYVQTAEIRERGNIEDALLGELLSGRRARRLSPYVKYTVAALARAVADAALPSHAMDQASAMLASMHGSAGYCYDYYSQIVREGVMAANPVLFAEGVPNAAAAHVSVLLGVRGACQTIIGSRTSGLDAVSLGALRIREGASDVVLVAAAEEVHPTIDRAYEAAFGFPLRSFAGACGIVLESAEHAQARGARAWATVESSHWSWRPQNQMTQAMAEVMGRLGSLRIIGTGAGTFLERVERLAARSCRVDVATCDATRIGEHFAT